MNNENNSCTQWSANAQRMKWRFGLLNDPNSNFRPLQKILTYFSKCYIYIYNICLHNFTVFLFKKIFQSHEKESLSLTDKALDYNFSAQIANSYIIFENVPTIWCINQIPET